MAISTNTYVLGEFANMGYSLKAEDGDHSVALYFKDGFVARFNQTKSTNDDIRAVCQDHWDRLVAQETY